MLLFESLIRSEKMHISRIDDALERTFINRAKSKADELKWKEAAETFRNYQSPLQEKLEAIQSNGVDGNALMIEFSIDFLELDPDFFRSGYYKSILLTKLK